MTSALVLGGAGFIGSNICRHLAAHGFKVTAIDGLLPRTFGNVANLASAAGDIQFISQRIEDLKNLPDLLAGQDIVVDAMGWTNHFDAFDDPEYDLSLNLASHIVVIRALSAARPKRMVYLGSTHQYGRVADGTIAENHALTPFDVQGVHKAAAEHHYRIAAKRYGLPIVSFRFGNTFGPAQPIIGREVGLIGDMIRRALAGEAIKVFGEGRRRTLHYAPDIAKIVGMIERLDFDGFLAVNIPGCQVTISDLAKQIASCAGGAVSYEALPADVAAIDVGNAQLDCTLFEKYFGPPRLTPFDEAMVATVNDARGRYKTPPSD